MGNAEIAGLPESLPVLKRYKTDGRTALNPMKLPCFNLPRTQVVRDALECPRLPGVTGDPARLVLRGERLRSMFKQQIMPL